MCVSRFSNCTISTKLRNESHIFLRTLLKTQKTDENYLQYELNDLQFSNCFVPMSFCDCCVKHLWSTGALVSTYIHLTYSESKVTAQG